MGFCGTFAFRALIQQYNCRENNGNCKLPAINGLIGQTFRTFGPTRITDPLALTQALSATNFVTVSEACYPFSSYWGAPSERSLRQGTYDDLYFHRMLDTVTTNNMTADQNCLARAIWETDKSLVTQINHLLGYAFQATFRELGTNVSSRLEGGVCERSSITPFKVHSHPYSGDMAAVRRLLDQGQSIMVGLTIPQPNGQGRGSHGITIVNHRETCCHGICSRQYQILDSLNFYWTRNSADGWVNESDLQSALKNPQPLQTLVRDPDFQPRNNSPNSSQTVSAPEPASNSL